MKVTCTHNDLLEAVTIAERVSGKKLTLPVLNCVLLEAQDNKLIIRATNLELGVEIVVRADVEEKGMVALTGSVLVATLSSTEVQHVVLSSDKGNVVLTMGKNRAILKAQPPEDFPTLPKLTDAQKLTISPQVFSRGVRGVIYSASTSSIKPEQASVYLYERENQLYFVATDSFRLAEKKVNVEGKIPSFDPILIPAKNVLEILRMLDVVEDNLTVSFTHNQISFESPHLYVTSRLIDGTFPDYRQVIPKEGVTEAVVLKQDLLQSLKRAAIFADTTNQVSIHIDPKHKSFTLEARNADVGESKDSIQGALSGDKLDINFNYHYLADCFPALATDSLTLSFGGLGRPLIIRGVSDPSFLYLVMPMNK